MITVKVTLKNGLKVGDIVHTEAEIREASAGDFIDASEESERLCLAPDGSYVLVASPSMVGVHTLRKQIVKIGEYPGPLTMGEMRLLSYRDINLLQVTANLLDNAAAAGVSDRGRGDAAQE